MKSNKIEENKQRIPAKVVDNAYLYAMIFLPVLALFIFSYLPMAGLVLAFKDYKVNLGIFGSEWVGFENLEFFIKSRDFARVTRNTIGMNLLFMFFGTVSAVTVAILMNNVRKKQFVKIYQTAILLPHFLSWVIVGYILYALLNPEYGFINGLLSSLGFEKVSWYTEKEYWPVILTLSYVWKHVGMSSIVYYAAIIGIDDSLIEAAIVDGASNKQVIWHVILPSLLPMIIMMNILSVGQIFRADFGLFYQLSRDVGRLYPVTDVFDTYIFRVMKDVGDIGTSTAAGLLQSVVGLICVVTTNKIVKHFDEESALF